MLDSSFSLNGKAPIKRVTTGNYTQAITTGMVLQEDGKIVAAGYVSSKTLDYDYFLTRYLSDGRIDNSFGNKGVVYTSYGARDFLSDMKKQSTGKLVVIGKTFSGDTVSFQMNRYNTDGSFDSSFGKRGWIDLQELSYSIAILPDDKILVCGTKDQNNYTVTVRKFNKEGTVDSSFGQSGLAAVTLGINSFDANHPLINLDKKERIVIGVTGSFPRIQNNHIVVIRLTKKGYRDSSFNKSGIATGNTTDLPAIINAITVQPDNKIVVAGTTVTDLFFQANYFLSRFSEDGSEDNSFGNGGVVTTDFTLPDAENEFPDGIVAIGIQNDGKIVAVGNTSIHIIKDRISLARYLPEGQPDSSFGINGRIITTVLYQNVTEAGAMAIQRDGKILVGGYAGEDNSGSNTGGEVTVIRYLKEKNMPLLIADKITNRIIPSIQVPLHP